MDTVKRMARSVIRIARWALQNETVAALLVLIIAWGAFSAWQAIQAPGKIDPALTEAMKGAQYSPRIELDLGFTPEDFHMNFIQRFGPMAGASGQKLFMIQVPADQIMEIAKLYWVQQIRLAP